MNQQNTQPLYRVLNEKRTQGEFVSFKNPLSKNGEYIVKAMPSEIYVHHVSSDETLDDNETRANADYTVLAVNNLAKIADALSKAVAQEERKKSIAEIMQESYIEPIWLNESKEALKAIS